MDNRSHQVRTDIAVVGGGIAGLVAAALARREGHEVVVIDPAPLGGRGRTDERSGFLFNRGPHAVYLGGPAERILRDLGCSLAGAPPSAQAFGRVGDTVHPLPTTAGALARTRLLGWRGKVALARFQSQLKAAKADRLGETTFADWLDAQRLPADARGLVEMVARVSSYANAPELASADMVVGQMQLAGARGVRYLHGGWQTIVDHLAPASAAHLHATATAITRAGADVVVECAGGSHVVAKAAVVALADPQATARLLGRAPFDVGPPVEAVCLDLGLTAPPPIRLLLGIDQPLYLSVHSPSARLAPEGKATVHVARYLSPSEAGDTTGPEHAKAQLRAHATHAGIAPEHIVEERFLHRMTVVGAMATAATGGLRGRPGTHDSTIDGVFLAGDWVGPTGHLLDASVASAAEASRAACRAVTLVGR